MPANVNVNVNLIPNTKQVDVAFDSISKRASSVKFGQPLGRISGDVTEFRKSLEAATARVTAFGLTAGAIYKVSEAIRAGARATVEIDKQLVELNTFLGQSRDQLEGFSQSLFKVARNAAVPFEAASEAAKEFARQGLSANEVLRRTEDALTLARISGISYADAVNGVTTAINSFNKEALTSTDIVNKLIAVDTRFAVSSAQLNEALSRVGSSAEESGISIDKLIATVTAAQQITGRGGAVIGNALKTIFTRLQRPEVLSQLEQLGVAIKDQNGFLLDGLSVLKNYADATKNLSQIEKSRTAELIGGIYQINQVNALIKDLSSSNSVYASALKISSAATDEAKKKNEELNKSLSALLQQTKNQAQEAAAALGKPLLEPLVRIGSSFSEILLKAVNPTSDLLGKSEESGKSVGESFFKGAASALGKTIATGSIPLLVGIGGTLLAKMVKFGVSSIKDVSKNFDEVFAGEKSLASQKAVNDILSQSPKLVALVQKGTISLAAAEQAVLQTLREQNKQLKTQEALRARIIPTVVARGGPSRVRASGYVPTFGGAQEEVAMAKAYGAKNPKAKLIQATIKGKTQPVMVNSEEDIIPNFAGTGDTAIIPKYRKMQDIPRMSSGYVPNFSWSKTNKMPKEFLAKYPESRAAIKAGRMYSPEVRGMLQKLQSGENIDRGLLEALIERDIPIREVVAPSSIKNLPSKSLIRNALDKEQAKRVGKLSELPAGSSISVRQDVPSMTRKGVGVVKTLGPEGFKSYDSFVAFDNPVMNKSTALEKASLAIGAGANKSPLLKISGTLSENQSLPKDLSSWTQVGFNPDRHSYYYDRKTKKPVVGGSKAIQIGNTVFVKDAQYGKKEDFLYAGGYVPNFSSISGSFGSVSKINESQVRKTFFSGAGQSGAGEIANEFLASRKLSEQIQASRELGYQGMRGGYISDLFQAPNTYGTLQEAVKSGSIVKDFVPGKTAAEVSKELDAYTGEFQNFRDLVQGFGRLAAKQINSGKVLEARDLANTGNLMLNDKAEAILTKIIGRRNPERFIRRLGSSWKNTSRMADWMAKKGARISLIDPGVFGGLDKSRKKQLSGLGYEDNYRGFTGINAAGYIPNFAKRKDIIQRIGKKEIFARFQKHYEQGKDYAGFYNIHGEEFSGKKLSPQEAKIYANITSAISPSVPDYVAAQFAAPIFNRYMKTKSTNVEDYFDLAPSKIVSRHKNVASLGLFGKKGEVSAEGNIRTRDDARRYGLSKALRGVDLGSDDTAKTRHYARAILQDKTAFPIDTNVIQAILGGKKPSKTEATKLISLANEFAKLHQIETGAAGLQAAIFKSNSVHKEKYSPETVRSALSGIEGRASGYVPNFAKILIAAKYYDGLKVGRAKGVNISKTGDVQIIGREVFGGIGFSASRIGKGYASAVRSTSPTTALKNASRKAGVTKSIIIPVVVPSAVNDLVPENLKTNEALLQQFLANHPKPKEIIASLSERGFNVKSILNSHSGAEIKKIIDILSSDLSNKKILAQSADQLKDPRLVKFFAPGGVKARGPKGAYAFGSSIASMQQGEYASKVPGKHKSYPILVTGKVGPSISKPISAEEIFPGITDNKSNVFFSSLQLFGTRVLDTDNPEHLKLLDRLGYSKKILRQEKLIAGGYIPNFAGLSDAIGREKTMSGLPASQIMAHFDEGGNPIAVTNKRDEPNGLKDVVPNFAKIPTALLSRFFGKSGGKLANPISGALELFEKQAYASIIDELAEREVIPSAVSKFISQALPASAGVKNIGTAILSKNASTGSRIAAGLTGAAQIYGGVKLGELSGGDLDQRIQSKKFEDALDRSKKAFTDLAENTTELSASLSKLDAAYKDPKADPREIVKLVKTREDLIKKISIKNPELISRLAGQTSISDQITVLEENLKKAQTEEAIRTSALSFGRKGKITGEQAPAELSSFFNEIINRANTDIFKTDLSKATTANFGEILKKAGLDVKEFSDQLNTDQLKKAFIEALKVAQGIEKITSAQAKEIARISKPLASRRQAVEDARDIRTEIKKALEQQLPELAELAGTFSRRAGISASSEATLAIKKADSAVSFQNSLLTQLNDKEFLANLSPAVEARLRNIEAPGAGAGRELESLQKLPGLSEAQSKGIQKLIDFNSQQSRDINKATIIAEESKKIQLKFLALQEKIAFGGDIRASLNPQMRAEAMASSIRGPLTYQLGSMIGSRRGQIAGATDFLTDTLQKYPGLLMTKGGKEPADIQAVKGELTRLNAFDMQRDLMRRAGMAQMMGLGQTAGLLRGKAFDQSYLLESAGLKTNALFGSPEIPKDIQKAMGDLEKFNVESVRQAKTEDAALRVLENTISPLKEKLIEVSESQSKALITAFENGLKTAFGATGIKTALVNVTTDEVKLSEGNYESKVKAAASAYAGMGGLMPTGIPSNANGLTKYSSSIADAVNREKTALASRGIMGVPNFAMANINLERSPDLVTQSNPFGFAVTNSIDEKNGLRSLGMRSSGFVPNYAAFGEKAASRARENAKLGKLYVWDNIDNGFRKVNPNGTVDTSLIDSKSLPRGARTISTELSEGVGKKSILALKDPRVTKLDELSLPGIARSKSIDSILTKLDKQGKLTPKNLLAQIDKISGGKDVLIKTAFGESNVQSKGVYGLGGKLTTADARSIIGKFNRGTGSGFFTQEKVPTYYNELRVHVAVDDKGNIKIIKGGTVLKATGFDPSAGPSIKAYMDAGLSKSEAVKMTRSFRRSAEASAFDSIRALVKSKGIKNAFFGVDVGGTTLQSALDAGVKSREFYSGGRGRVGTIVFEVNPSDKTGSTGFMGRGLSEKLVKNIFGQKPLPGGLTSGSPAVGINPTGAPALPQSIRPSIGSSAGLSGGLPSGFSQKPSLSSSILNSVKDQFSKAKGLASKVGPALYDQAQNIAGKLGSTGSNLFTGAKGLLGQASAGLMSFGKNAINKGGTALSGLSAAALGAQAVDAFNQGNKVDAAIYGTASLALGTGLVSNLIKSGSQSKGKPLRDPTTGRFVSSKNLPLTFTGALGKLAAGGAGISGALTSGLQARDEFKAGQYGNAAVSATQAGLYGASGLAGILGKGAQGLAGKAFGAAAGIGLARDIVNAKNFELASNWSDVLFGKAEQGGGYLDVLGTALTAAGGPVGAAVATAKIGYRLGNVLGNKLGFEGKANTLGEFIAGAEASAIANNARFGYEKGVSKKEVIEGKASMSDYIRTRRTALEDLNKGQGLSTEGITDRLSKELTEISAARAQKQKEQEEQQRIAATIAQKAKVAKENEQAIKSEEAARNEEQEKFSASLRKTVVRGLTPNEDLSGLKTSRDKALYLLDQEKTFGKFTEKDFEGDKSLFESYRNYSRERDNANKGNKNYLIPEIPKGFSQDVLEEATKTGRSAERVIADREEAAARRGAAIQGMSVPEINSQLSRDYTAATGAQDFPKDVLEEAVRRRITAEQVMQERTSGKVPNFAAMSNSMMASGDVYSRMRMSAPRMSFPSAAQGSVPNFAIGEFSDAITEAMRNGITSAFPNGASSSSVSNSNVINIDGRTSIQNAPDEAMQGIISILFDKIPELKKLGPAALNFKR